MMRELLMASLLLLTDCLHVQQAKETPYGPYFFLAVVKSKLINGLLGESTLSVPSQEPLIQSLSESAEKAGKAAIRYQ